MILTTGPTKIVFDIHTGKVEICSIGPWEVELDILCLGLKAVPVNQAGARTSLIL